jgi:CRISPR-associated endonuclease Cas1
MQQAVSPVAETFTRDTPASDICVADGYGIRIFVNGGHLVVHDGIGRRRRDRRYARATHGLPRLVVLGHTGYITFEAQRWMANVGIDYVHLETDGRILSTSERRVLNHPALRRAQALAFGTAVGLAITRELLDAKMRGQAKVAASLKANAVASEIDILRRALANAADIEACRLIEAKAAATYWRDAWAPVSVQFIRRDAPKVPDHWKSFGGRQSALATVASPRRATNPANALLNYLYALGEAEARLALLAVGLDPGLAFLHVDQKPRDSAALDVLEATRFDIDAYVLRLLRERSWSHRDFTELDDGTCRILAPVTHDLAATMPSWAQRVAPVVERIASLLGDSMGRPAGLPTPLSQANRSAGRQGQRRRPTRKEPRPTIPSAVCETCGVPVARARKVCNQCLKERRSFAGTIGRRGGTSRMATSPDVLSEREACRKAAVRWAETGCPESAGRRAFDREIRFGLRDVPIKVIAAATGLSPSYCGRIRSGPATPHARHWAALRSLVDSGAWKTAPK